MARPFATPVKCTCPMCGRTINLPPSKAARFVTCRDHCRSTLNFSTRHWDILMLRLTTKYHNRYSCIGGFDLDDPVGDPLDRARFATVDGQRFLFARSDSGGWLKFSSVRNLEGIEVFGGDRFETVVDAPPCEVRAAQQRRLIEAYQEIP